MVFLFWYNQIMRFKHTDTNLSVENEYPKLVRDKIPEIIKAGGREVPVRTLEQGEFIDYLKKKAVEEAMELAAADTDMHLLEEIADIRELLDALESAKGFSADDVKSVQDDKRNKRGGFTQRLLMLNND
ncbi:MAG: phosphoribosyl-ATP pyrophosphohydrolase [Candidatus Saccharibacteria bacterium]|nr:phosphoribosyl-ATP pyrophosphohydrolase [Candidatus Saccharibacteria bacterium]